MSAIFRWALGVLTAAGLGIDAYTHLDLASNYMPISSGSVNQGVLFQIEGIAAIVIGLAVLARPNALTGAMSALFAGGGAAVLLIYRYVEVGKIGPIPDMSEPIWFTEKQWSLAGELVAFAAGVGLVAVALVTRRPASTSAPASASA